MEMIGAGTSETRIIGIHGMGGIGKTTIAKLIYNNLSHNFEHCCFLRDVRETSKNRGIQCLQNQLVSDILKTKCIDIEDIDEGTQTIEERLSNKRVLLLLDDAEEGNHIDALIGRRDWLGRGSKIIITTRNKSILDVPEVDYSYELSEMDVDQSLQLFSRHAFRQDYPLDEYIGQSMRAIGIARGLPLALEVIGSLLCRTKKEKWDLTLKKLENVPHAAVRSKLKISYDALDVRQQDIFLDIACLFIGYNEDIVIYFWDESKFPEEAMEVLQNMSLIKIEEDNIVWMHDQLRDLGREIVREKSKMKIENQSRVWDPKEALDLLRRPEGKKEVEALRLKFDRKGQFRFTYEGFKNLSDLRFLQVRSWGTYLDGPDNYFDVEERLLWHESPLNVLPTNVFLENSDLLPQLRWLSWRNIPTKLKITNFYMENVVILDLFMSGITHDWQGWSHVKVMKNLKVLDLHDCYSLERTPNFSAHSNLEHLLLSDCYNLVEIDNSICQLTRLVSLKLDGCAKLQRLPKVVGRDPDTIGNLELLIKLDISYTNIKELPDSIGKWKNLKVLNMMGSAISKIPYALWMIVTLERIEFEAKHAFDVEIGNCIYENRCLRILRLVKVKIDKVPRLPESLINLELDALYMDTIPDLSNLVNLERLKLGFHPRDDGGASGGPVEEYPMPQWIENLSKLEFLELCSDYVTTLPIDLISILRQLKSLKLKGAHVRCLPSLPSTLSTLLFDSEYVTTLPTDGISLLPQLKSLELRCCNLRCLPSLPSSLSKLELYSKCLTTLPTDMSSLLPRLEKLEFVCPKLCCLPSLPSSLSELRLIRCKSLSSLGDLSNLKGLSWLYIHDCAISDIRFRDPLENLRELDLWYLQRVKSLPSLGNFNKLSFIHVLECGSLVEIQGELPQSLEELKILGCGSLKELPDLSRLKRLKKVRIKCYGNLDVEAISSLCLEKSVEFGEEDSDDQYEPEQEDNESESESEGEGD
ncbi:disease resistance protein RPV1-like [Eucalyptus grandis]|uniref:disease resistance protein RPV1-like n=1 Tax=Eucalyptus grandis TaxID=71139 RepID=UPI00192EE306|nr:disease resistance protein RPV1-like [Eucalyptus grandis]XP_039154890.1 disease resistance protein RPV1-like [Eucalyptus grandis]